MRGRRVYCDDDGRFFADTAMTDPVGTAQAGDYWFYRGHWAGVCPNDRWCNLKAHAVTEHEDGTVTVSPSILLHGGQPANPEWDWHGFLERGVWRSC